MSYCISNRIRHISTSLVASKFTNKMYERKKVEWKTPQDSNLKRKSIHYNRQFVCIVYLLEWHIWKIWKPMCLAMRYLRAPFLQERRREHTQKKNKYTVMRIYMQFSVAVSLLFFPALLVLFGIFLLSKQTAEHIRHMKI